MKRLPLLFIIGCILSLTSCEGNKEIEKDNSLIFTEFANGVDSNSRAVEVYNISNKTIDLANYTICIYRSFLGEDRPTDVIHLSGQLEKYKTYVVAYDKSEMIYLNKANLISENLMNIGSFSMALKYKNNYVVDTIGSVGTSEDIAMYSDLVRKVEFFSPRGSQYEPYDWIRYPAGDISHLGNIDCISNNELMNGPKLLDEDLHKPYCLNSSNGNGGAMSVTLNYTIDGDTTKFNFGYTYSSLGISGSNSVRYYGINTPEIAHGDDEVADPYGDEAKDFTNSIINNSSKFRVQSIKDYTLHETYGRLLGYVWVSQNSSPSAADYSMMSHLIVLSGYAKVAFIQRGVSYFNSMLYKGISYIEYLYDAQNYAKLHKLNIYSEN